MLHPGLYEQVINNQLASELEEITEARKAVMPIDKAEASNVLAKYLTNIVQKGLDDIAENNGGVQAQINLTNQIISLIQNATNESDYEYMGVAYRAEQLLALLQDNDPRLILGKTAKDVERPETSVAQSSLFTGAGYEPQMFSELKKEIATADQIDMLVSFIKWSGLRLIMDELREFTQNGGQLRIITTSYMGATDIKAVEELSKLPNTEIKVSYDTKRTRLHAKTYVFYRDTGFTTAYVGSSNLSNAAISSGLEWNVKVAAKDLASTVQKITATFDSYWNSTEFEFYKEDERERLFRALRAERMMGNGNNRAFVFDIHPYPYQQEILDKLQAEREVRGKTRNLVVAATGTGKTVISAFDYRRFCKNNSGQRNRLLFVAHREEILKQSLDTFQGVLKDPNFGELFVGGLEPTSLDHLFTSVQTLNSQALYDSLPVDYYDYIIVDEFHHAAAPTYQKILNHFRPKILLGLTATPERMDGKSILDYFDGRVAAEIRLPEAIDRKLLCPFQYFGVADTVDLTELRWVRGSYDRSQLTNLYSLNRSIAERRADHIIRSLEKYVTDMDAVKGLGFCVSIEHARFMAEYFNASGIPSICLIGRSGDEERRTAKRKLVDGEIRFVFVVDIYNEGVDIPEVNTVLFLRPTESLTIFLQQLGRGLRLSEGKECLTVLDFIGQANKHYNFEEKFAALLSNTTHSVQHELKNGFISAPKGCYIQLEKKAAKAILDNIKGAFNSKNGLLSRISTFEEDSGLDLTLANFLNYYRLDPRAIYKKATFYSLCSQAGKYEATETTLSSASSKILFRLCTLDSGKLIHFWLTNLEQIENVVWENLCETEQLMWKMLYVSVWERPPEALGFKDFIAGINEFKCNTDVYNETIELLAYCYDRITVVGVPADLSYQCPLEVRCTYTRSQILAALGFVEDYSISEGVTYLKEKDTDVFFTTLNKADKYYSPSTAYDDYSINEWLFHWQSQSKTSDQTNVGKRYIGRKKGTGYALLFVRERKSDSFGAQPFVFLGTVYYVQHQGSRPMSITWKLEYPIPSKYLKITNKLIPE